MIQWYRCFICFILLLLSFVLELSTGYNMIGVQKVQVIWEYKTHAYDWKTMYYSFGISILALWYSSDMFSGQYLSGGKVAWLSWCQGLVLSVYIILDTESVRTRLVTEVARVWCTSFFFSRNWNIPNMLMQCWCLPVRRLPSQWGRRWRGRARRRWWRPRRGVCSPRRGWETWTPRTARSQSASAAAPAGSSASPTIQIKYF